VFNPAAAEELFSAVNDRGLSRGYSRMWFIEAHLAWVVFG
jgi:hypothetical protein